MSNDVFKQRYKSTTANINSHIFTLGAELSCGDRSHHSTTYNYICKHRSGELLSNSVSDFAIISRLLFFPHQTHHSLPCLQVFDIQYLFGYVSNCLENVRYCSLNGFHVIRGETKMHLKPVFEVYECQLTEP